MENSQTPDSEYTKHFNIGYAFSKHLPELSEKVSQGKSQTPAFLAMQDGRNQYIAEKERGKLPLWLRKYSPHLKARSFAKDKGRTNDPER
ncbi:hypothetical protein MUK70_18950 [Dyadobacter chenwenxiniae]|uniref:Uncharacterized protein n=1 Tax=Dyadobacter chenwenxiniae TaxID=2906456 RepID=A0A9X1PJW3_9BACT|nr:hypothetical protein [Dyadobacter chenwenxiniae]MCF0061319.1 hypothetical protein [Dyadobacter chenwenxiniae]UON81141.1 hypothetical protein MUK70_18950 [Dyadobacter chenwenxiniae]